MALLREKESERSNLRTPQKLLYFLHPQVKGVVKGVGTEDIPPKTGKCIAFCQKVVRGFVALTISAKGAEAVIMVVMTMGFEGAASVEMIEPCDELNKG